MKLYHEQLEDKYSSIDDIILMSDDESEGDEGSDQGIAVEKKPKLQQPRKYKVLLHNDDYTTMEFVIHVLKKFFNKTSVDAQRIMMHVHTKGMGVCGVFTYEVAESKVAQVTKYARKNGHPLRCTCEPCDS
jgi:ATP-dependent Clp protease adaptor protein ClpS